MCVVMCGPCLSRQANVNFIKSAKIWPGRQKNGAAKEVICFTGQVVAEK